MKRSAEDAAKTRLALLEAALMAFEAKGWRGATFEHVAERAGVTRGALHHHFRSKASLLTESLDWGWSEYGQRLLSASDDPSDTAWLQRLLTDYITLLRTDDRFRALAYTTVLVAPQALDSSEKKNDALDAWRERIATVLASSERSPVTAQTTAGLILVLLQGLTVTAVTRPRDLPPAKELDDVTEALVNGLLS